MWYFGIPNVPILIRDYFSLIKLINNSLFLYPSSFSCFFFFFLIPQIQVNVFLHSSKQWFLLLQIQIGPTDFSFTHLLRLRLSIWDLYISSCFLTFDLSGPEDLSLRTEEKEMRSPTALAKTFWPWLHVNTWKLLFQHIFDSHVSEPAFTLLDSYVWSFLVFWGEGIVSAQPSQSSFSVNTHPYHELHWNNSFWNTTVEPFHSSWEPFQKPCFS